ncbi:MAG TPA: hypothetical protein VHM02_16180 [Thermoanaerobaculia bacterium]|nr:hypothetical protein [Thermoanaerobaculia bacterium]
MRPPRLTVALLAAGLAAGCASSAYRSTVREIDRLPQAERVRVPFLGVARVASNLAGGPEGLRLAIFETSPAAAAPVGDVLARHAGRGWQRLLRARSDGEDVVILARPEGDRLRLLLVVQEPREVVVLEVAIEPEELLATIDDRGARFR